MNNIFMLSISKFGKPIVAVLILCAAGCSNQHKETAQVRGRVTLDGKPLSAGGVNFVPAAGRSAGGVIQPDGSYSLSTYAPSDGAIVGIHKISVCPPVLRDGDPEPKTLEAPIPVRYHNPESSGLRFEVKAGEDNVFDIALTSQG